MASYFKLPLNIKLIHMASYFKLTLNINKSWSEPGNAPRIGIGHREVDCQK